VLKTGNRKIDHFRLYYTDKARLVGTHKLPQLRQQHHVPHDAISFNARNSVRDLSRYWIDHFIDDYSFEGPWNTLEAIARLRSRKERIWRRLENYAASYRRAAGVIAPDYSMLPEMLPDQRNWNCARNRISAYALESGGIATIPVACWCTKEDFDWCFDGLASDSTVAISTNGCLSTAWSRDMLLRGVDALVKKKDPWLLVVCGNKVDDLDSLCRRVMYYPSFSERLRRGRRNG